MKKHERKVPGLSGWLLVCLALTACQPALTPVARPTPAILTVQATPALLPLAGPFHDCAQALENTGLVLLTRPASSLDLAQSPLALRWGASGAPEGSAAVIGEEDLVIIAHPKNTLQKITLADLQSIYLGRLKSGAGEAGSTEIQPWSYPAGDDVQAVFDAVLLNGGQPSGRTSYIAPDPGAMRKAIAANPSAIGFLPRRWVDPTVKVLSVDGLDPAQLRQPILAVSKSEPTGQEKTWLLCLQKRLSE